MSLELEPLSVFYPHPTPHKKIAQSNVIPKVKSTFTKQNKLVTLQYWWNIGANSVILVARWTIIVPSLSLFRYIEIFSGSSWLDNIAIVSLA